MDITQQQRATDFQKGKLNIYLPVMGLKESVADLMLIAKGII